MTQWLAGLGQNGDYLARLLLAGLCGSAIGLERELRGHYAGFRTHLLICLGSALSMIISTVFATRSWPQGVTVDPARIAYGVMTGMGFIGAGTIIHSGASVRGLTSAAALWCIAAIGLTAGYGMITLTLGATLMVFLALWLLDRVEELLPRRRMVMMVIRTRWSDDVVDRVRTQLIHSGIHVGDILFERSNDLKTVDVFCAISYRRDQPMAHLQNKINFAADMELMAMRGA